MNGPEPELRGEPGCRNGWRGVALGLAAAGAALLVAFTTAVVVVYLRGSKEAILGQEALNALRARLAEAPTDEGLKARIRLEDEALRRRYFHDLARLRTGAYLILASAAIFLASVQWCVSFRPRGPRPRSMLDRRRPPPAATRRRGVQAVCVVASLVAVVFAGAALWPRDPLPPADWAKVLAGGRDIGGPPPAVAYKDNWPQFRGPTGVGLAPAGDWPDTWDARTRLNVVWSCPAPVSGLSSPIVWQDRIFLTGADPKRNLLQVACIDRTTGRVRWTTNLTPGFAAWTKEQREEFDVPSDTGWAAPTPATDGTHVFVTFATADVACLDFDGKVLWQKNFGAPNSTYGLASSLLVYKDLCIWQFDQGRADENRSEILALHAATGERAWSAPRPVNASWSTPALIRAEGSTELVTTADPWVIAYDPESGLELWRAKGVEGDVAPGPAFADGVVYVANTSSNVVAIRAGGSGDVTETHTVYSVTEGKTDIASPICDGERLLQATSSGLVTCLEAKTGKLLWEHEFPDGFKASPILAGTLVYLTDSAGKTHIIEMADSFVEKGTADVGQGVDATPAFGDGFIYVRGRKDLFCIGKRGP